MIKLVVGTEKGAFILSADEKRENWSVTGPLFKGWKATATARSDDGRFLLGTASFVYGAAVQVSRDLENWQQMPAAPAYDAEASAKLNQIWKILPVGDRVYVGVDDAGLFATDDDGKSWQPISALNEHRTRANWYPGFGGLCAHSLLVDPAQRDRVWVGISAVGVFRSDDGGASWASRNEGVPVIIEDKEFKEIGFCVHALVADPADANRIWRQDHKGMFRTTDGGDHWERIENGLPSGFGFPLVRDPSTGALFCIPMETDEFRVPPGGKLRVYRSTDDGDSWQAMGKGLPEGGTFCNVLRGAMSVDEQESCGVYFGTTSGQLFASNDCGDTCKDLGVILPRILSVDAFEVEG